MAVTTPYLNATEKKHWWLTNRKVVEKYIRDARSLMATQEQSEIASALNLLDAALAIYPRLDEALELRARCLLCLRRFKEVADMLQDYIPSLKMANDESVSSDSSSQQLSREGAKLLSSDSSTSDQSFKCFSVSDLKKKVMAGLCKSCDKEGYWRYLVLGKACCHLGLMEDAMVLLQTGKRLASAAFRRESVCWSDDSFSLSNPLFSGDTTPPRAPMPESEAVTQLLAHIKLLLRRRAAALAALEAGLHSEAIRHFSKIVDGRRGAPQAFLAECYMYRASAHRSAGRIADSISDCNRTLALDPTCIQALETRASILESIRCFPDSLHDLEHLKLLYNTILRDRKLAGPAWKRQNVRAREIPGKLCALTTKIQELKQRVASGDTSNVDYHGLIGLRRGCGRSLSPPTSSAMSKRVITELVLGLDYATQLKFLLQNPVGPDGSVAAKELVTNVQRSFAETLSLLTSSEAASGEDEVAQNLVISGEDASQAASIDIRSEDSTESRKRSLPLSKDRRGSYKRRKTEQTWSIVSQTTDDNHAWRKYGQKDILNSQFPRSYFRCTRKFEQGCKAMKQVQRLEENPDMYNITYIGLHTCKDTLKAPQMVTYETWDSFLENSHADLNVPNEQKQHDPPIRSQSPIVKQEYPNDESDPTDADLWSDLKDFELSNEKPGFKIVSENADAFMFWLPEFGHEC